MFVKPPKETNGPGKVWPLKTVVYGLSDASRAGYLRVVEELKRLQVIVSKYDKALFDYKVDDCIQGILLVHVDDFLWYGSDNFKERVISPLKVIFQISKKNDTAFKYIGVYLKTRNDILSFNQEAYIDCIESVPSTQ